MKGLFVSGKTVLDINFFTGIVIKLKRKAVGGFCGNSDAVAKRHVNRFRKTVADFLILALKSELQNSVLVHAVSGTVRGTVGHVIEVVGVGGRLCEKAIRYDQTEYQA